MSASDGKLIKIGVVYDGNFFSHVSNFYQYRHERRTRISISGLHEFIRSKVAENEGEDKRYCQIVDMHYFRGRLRAAEASDRDVLLKERSFDDVLMREGVTTHYLPIGPDGEKGVDVWLALETFELAMYKRYNVVALIACDGDFLPLVRKLHTLGTRVMILGWDFRYGDNGERVTRTAQALLDEASYPLLMHQIIDDRTLRNDPLVNGIFLPRRDTAPRPVVTPFPAPVPAGPAPAAADGAAEARGTVQVLKEGYGWIRPDGEEANIYFHFTELRDVAFPDLQMNDRLSFIRSHNEKGPCAVEIRRMATE